MATNLFSRLVPGKDDRSYYDRLHDDQDVDIENRAGLALDEENLTHNFHDDDIHDAHGLALDDSRISTNSTAPLARHDPTTPARRRKQGVGARWLSPEDDGDNEVPESLLVEQNETPTAAGANPRRTGTRSSRRQAAAGPSRSQAQAQTQAQAQWETTQAQQRLHPDEAYSLPFHEAQSAIPARRVGLNANPKDKAMFRWANVSNLDNFMEEVYEYYLGAGLWCILLDRLLHLFKVIFMACLLTVLSQCIDYAKIRDSKHLSQVVIPKCTKNMWGIWNLGLWLCSFYVIWKTIQFALDIPRLLHIRDFYNYLLEIPEEDMQTVSWQDIVSRITGLRDANVKTASNITPSQRRFLSKQLGPHVVSQSKERLDAHDIANRLMRRENYIIALFNKDILDFGVPIPFLRNRPFFSQTLLWTLQFSILDLVFNESNQVRPQILKSDHRGQLSRDLKHRFAFAAVMNLIFAPFVAAFLLIDFIFTYYNEFKTNTSFFGVRQYTPLAEWKFREFNELPHIFKERKNMSYPFAKHYIDQFPKKKTESAAKAMRFFAGALIAIIAIIGFSDPEMFVDFDVFPGMNALAFLAVCTTTWALANGMISEENEVFDPEYAMRNVIEYTHYEPDQWKGRLHSFDVKTEFSELYKPKIVIFLEGILGVLLTPLILFFSLPRCSDQIIDFFREFTIHVDGLGYVCSFAVFDFQKDQRNAKKQGGHTDDAREDYYATKHGKMQASMYGFLDNYVYNPRSGLPGNRDMGPAGRHQFHPPPAFPGLNSPTLAADMRASRMGRSERPRSRAPPGAQQAGRTPRFGPAMPQPSPMASMLLDPHNQPSGSFIAGRGNQRARQQRAPYLGEGGITEKSTMEGRPGTLHRTGTAYLEDEVEESVARLGESTWEDSPRRGLSRENSSAATDGEDGPGVVKLLKQFQQTHMNARAGAIL